MDTKERTHYRSRRFPENQVRPPPIMMTSTRNILRLQSELKEHVKGYYEFRNT
jgi:hypothetical protein